MPIRPIKPRSERGSLKDVLEGNSYEPPTTEELKLKQLYEFAESTEDQSLKEALGFIVMPQAGNKNAFPITVYQHREYISSLSKKMADKIEHTKQELMACFVEEPSQAVRVSNLKQRIARHTILESGGLIIKVASANVSVKEKRSFRRAR